jgi:hypothetical protein
MGAVIVIVVLVLAGAGFVFVLVRDVSKNKARTADISSLGKELGFTAGGQEDEGRLLDLPVEYLHRGDKRETYNEIFGMRNGTRTALFDFGAYTMTGGTVATGAAAAVRTKKHGHIVTCGLVEVPAQFPFLKIEHNHGAAPAGDARALSHVELIAVFNDRFELRADEQKFPNTVLADSLMRWLLAADEINTVEIKGAWILLACDKLDSSRWRDLLTWLDEFREHIPAEVYSAYPVPA